MSNLDIATNQYLFRDRGEKRAAFTLIELLVVITVMTLLVTIILPSIRRSIRQTRSTVCKSNLRDLYRSLDMYQTENNDWLPITASASASGFHPGQAWSSKLFENNPSGKGVLICPDDPWARVMRNNVVLGGFGLGGNSSYGLNDFIASSPGSFLANVGRYVPRRPDDTILLADMGPDHFRAAVPATPGTVPAPSRNSGRLAIDDGYRPGDPPEQCNEPWLADRHMGMINMLTLVGNVKEVRILPVLQRPIHTYYPDCAAQACALCVDFELPHYSFAESQAFWWTGSVPSPPHLP